MGLSSFKFVQCATENASFLQQNLQMRQNVFAVEARERWRAYSAPQDPLDGFGGRNGEVRMKRVRGHGRIRKGRRWKGGGVREKGNEGNRFRGEGSLALEEIDAPDVEIDLHRSSSAAVHTAKNRRRISVGNPTPG